MATRETGISKQSQRLVSGMAEIIPEKSDVQEVEESGPDMQKGEGHLKVPHFRTGEMLSLHCGLAGLMVNSILAVVVRDN